MNANKGDEESQRLMPGQQNMNQPYYGSQSGSKGVSCWKVVDFILSLTRFVCAIVDLVLNVKNEEFHEFYKLRVIADVFLIVDISLQ